MITIQGLSELVMAWAVTDRVVDGEATAPTIDGTLHDLETVAAKDGVALGIGLPYPVTFERVLAWAPALAAKGIVLAPSSAVAGRQQVSP